MSEEIREIKESISFMAETQRILSDSMLLQQQQFNEFQQILGSSLQEFDRRQQESERRFNASQQEFERRFNASQERLEAILLNQQRQINRSEERQAEAEQRFNVLLQELRHTNQRIDRIEQS
jgi:hypothetical protein